MRTFDIGGVLTEQSLHLLWIPIDHLRMHSNESTATALFDDLQIVPVCTWLLVCRRSAPPCIFGDLSPCREHRFPVAAFPIRGHRWRLLGVPTCFELPHQFQRDFFLRFGNGSPNAQPTVYLNGRPPPETASSLFFTMPPFSPL